MNKEITQIIRQYPNTDDCKFQTLKELWAWQETQVMDLIKAGKEEEKANYILIDGHIGDRIKMNYNEVISAFMNIEQDAKIGCRKGTEFLSIARVIRDSGED